LLIVGGWRSSEVGGRQLPSYTPIREFSGPHGVKEAFVRPGRPSAIPQISFLLQAPFLMIFGPLEKIACLSTPDQPSTKTDLVYRPFRAPPRKYLPSSSAADKALPPLRWTFSEHPSATTHPFQQSNLLPQVLFLCCPFPLTSCLKQRTLISEIADFQRASCDPPQQQRECDSIEAAQALFLDSLLLSQQRTVAPGSPCRNKQFLPASPPPRFLCSAVEKESAHQTPY